jgi:hypothetical protein
MGRVLGCIRTITNGILIDVIFFFLLKFRYIMNLSFGTEKRGKRKKLPCLLTFIAVSLCRRLDLPDNTRTGL